MAKQDSVSLTAVGDVCVNREDPDSAFALCAPTTRDADIAFCQLETMFSEKGTPAIVAIGPLRAHPRNISALKFGGFDVVSMAGNHVLDWGDEAMLDTKARLEAEGMRVIGVGKNIEEARKPAIVERKGIKFAFLAYNTILPHRYWADENKAGCVPLRASTLYEATELGQPGTPCRILTFAEKADLEAMKNDVINAKKQADIVAVSFHFGLHFVPALIAMYQKEVAYAAIDCGADLILGHHAHILKGIEVYKGKVITYGLCNWVMDIRLTPEKLAHPGRKIFARNYPNWGYFPDYPSYPFPIESRQTIALKCLISRKGVEKASYVPVYVNNQGQPEVLKRQDKRSDGVFNYMSEISKSQGLETKFAWEGDEVAIQLK